LQYFGIIYGIEALNFNCMQTKYRYLPVPDGIAFAWNQ
jgi:hypothetical protein